MPVGKIFYLVVLTLGVLTILFYIVTQNMSNSTNSIENSLKQIELQCADAKINIDAISNKFESSFGCIEDKVSSLAATHDPEEVATVAFNVYGTSEYPVLNRACHSIMHVLGYAKAVSASKELRYDPEELNGCWGGFLDGYAEAAMVELSDNEFAEKGFEACSKAVPRREKSDNNCAHMYGHYLYTKVDKKTGFKETGELTKYCEKLEKIYIEGCVTGIFMDYFGSDSAYLELTSNGSDFRTEQLLRPCYVNLKPEVTLWCIVVSWKILNKAAIAEYGDGEEAYIKFQEKCHDLSEIEQFYCGATLGWDLWKDEGFINVDKSVNDCVISGRGNEAVTSGCLSWGARLAWASTKSHDVFLKMCTNENNKKRGSCLIGDSQGGGGNLNWSKLFAVLS
jgi:hypothetical protein